MKCQLISMDDGVCVMAVTFCLIRQVHGVVASVLVRVLKEEFGILLLICRGGQTELSS